ncbi:MAG TPA: protein kinase, partial [Chloroflexota bacterium]|nr:protein kinase [Chloroflexota bacterium]
ETLHERLHREGPLPLREALVIVLEVARALEAAHTLGIVHRDLKPQNIILTDGQVKVLDFGSANAEGLAELTLTGSFVGTPHYCAPEQAAGGGDIRADIYSLGVILFSLLEGRLPFSGTTAMAVLQQHATVPPPPTPHLPPAVRTVIVRCLAKDPDERYQTPTELAAALEGALDSLPAPGSPRPASRLEAPPPVPPRPGTESAGTTSALGRTPGTAGTPVPLGTTPNPAPLRPLPASLTPLVGREAEAAGLLGLFTDAPPSGPRLVTLTGPGGAGKTRLAVHVAALLVAPRAGPPDGAPSEGPAPGSLFPDGAAFVELAPVADPQLVPAALATALGVPEVAGRSRLESVVGALRNRRLLLLLDNCEHVVEAVAGVVDAILRASPGVRVLATSREALGVQGEAVWRVPPLSAPDPAADLPPERLAQVPAVRLFLDRVAAVRPGFVLTAANAPAVAEICARLDGLPLALELAAARARVLSVEQIAARLGDRFRLLNAGSRTAPLHQQTLRAAMDWSHDLLAPSERVLFRRLAVFAGGCTLDAVEAVCASGDGDSAAEALGPFEVLDGVQALEEKSLLLRMEGEHGEGGDGAGGSEHGAGGEPRLTMLQTVRDYAAQRLEESGEVGAVRRRHFQHFLSLATTAEPLIRGGQQLAWLSHLERDHDNLRAALDWCATAPDAGPDGLRLATSLGWFWYLRGHRAEGCARLEALLALEAGVPQAGAPEVEIPATVRSRALGVAAHLSFWTGAPRAYNRRLAEEAEALARASGDALTLAWALLHRAVVQQFKADRERLEAWWGEALDCFTRAGEPWGAALALSWRGQLRSERGETAPAAGDAQESLERFRRLGDRWGTALALARAAVLSELQGDLAGAERAWQEQQVLARELGHRGAMAGGLSHLAVLRLRRGDSAAAVTLFERSVTLFRAIGERGSTAPPLAQLALLAGREEGGGGSPRAWALLREALRVWREQDDVPGLARGLYVAAALTAAQGDLPRAARLAGAGEAALALRGLPSDPLLRAAVAAERDAVRATLPEEGELAEAWSAGRALPLDQALALATAPPPHEQQGPQPP